MSISDEDFLELEKKLNNKYYLITKGRVWQFLGGTFGFIIAVGIISWGTFKIILSDAEVKKEKEEIRNDRDSMDAIKNRYKGTLDTLDANVNLLPVGTIIAYSGEKIPDGWLLCNGDTINGNDPRFIKLYHAIHKSWGHGDDTDGSFNLPDLQGRFLRGVDSNAGNDLDKQDRFSLYGGNSGNKIGSYQMDAYGPKYSPYSFIVERKGESGELQINVQPTGNTKFFGNGSHVTQDISIGTGAETRPKNAYVYYIIKE